MLSAFYGNTHISDPYVDNSNRIFIQAEEIKHNFSLVCLKHTNWGSDHLLQSVPPQQRGVLRSQINVLLSYLEFKGQSFLCHEIGSVFTWLNHHGNWWWTRTLVGSRLCSEHWFQIQLDGYIFTDYFIYMFKVILDSVLGKYVLNIAALRDRRGGEGAATSPQRKDPIEVVWTSH